jgi:hypothetical protein
MIRKAIYWLIRASNLETRPKIHSVLVWISRVVISLIVINIVSTSFLEEPSVFLDFQEGLVLLGIIVATPCWLWLFYNWMYQKNLVLKKF